MGRMKERLLNSDTEQEGDEQQDMAEIHALSIIEEAAELCSNNTQFFDHFMTNLYYYKK